MNLGNRYSQHSFAIAPSANIARSQFDRSFTIKDTFDFDYLVPIFLDEIVPGDTANLNMKTFARLSTQKVPIMDNLYIDYFFFFVPARLVWDNWEKFNGAQDNPGDSVDFTIPQLTIDAGGAAVGSIYDKMGIPTGVPNLSINALPLRAYNLIYNTWFRDQNLQNSLTVSKDNGPDLEAEYSLQKRGKRHDYFTSCLPSPQKGSAVELPLGTTAPIISTGTTLAVRGSTGAMTNVLTSGVAASAITINTGTTAGGVNFGADNAVVAALEADLSSAAAVTINELREAIQIQSLLELDARGGTRYVEILQSHFHVISPDFRLQRPEYLGGGQTRINSHPVAQTSPTSGSNALGQLAAFATTSTMDQNIGFTKSFTEHGYVIGLACARADITYQQGLNRMWKRSTRYDFFWPKLQELGEQAVLNQEIYAQGDANDALVFGYQERYAEYRYKPSEIHGEFRSTFATAIDQWHMAEEFSALPAFNSAFIVQNTPIARALAVTDGPDILMDCWFQYRHARPMLTYSVPSTMGKF